MTRAQDPITSESRAHTYSLGRGVTTPRTQTIHKQAPPLPEHNKI